MVDLVVDVGVEDTLEAREADVRRRHTAGEFGEVPLEWALLGTRAQWVRDHSPPRAAADGASALPRPVRNEGGVDKQVDGGDLVGSDEGTRKMSGVIRAVAVRVYRIHARVQQSTAAASSSHGGVDGRRRSSQRSGVRQISSTHVISVRIH
ncbi:unnamed protein product [Closterium sp. NIES-53]